jgi:hypothetical protein
VSGDLHEDNFRLWLINGHDLLFRAAGGNRESQ